MRADDELVGRFCAALELVHCASLAQDDLPCFDDAETRRGAPACHIEHGAATAILAGDALLALAFETLARAPSARAADSGRLIALLAAAVGSTEGVIGGQALELEPVVNLARYHRYKTAALFRAAAEGGAIAAGAAPGDVDRAAHLGELFGCAVQLRDDLDDVTARASALGKPVGRDESLGRPNAALRFGVEGARRLRAARFASARALMAALPSVGETLASWAADVAGIGADAYDSPPPPPSLHSRA